MKHREACLIIRLGHIDIDEPGQEAKLEAEISKVFQTYLNHIDQDCLGLSDKSIINSHAGEGVAVSSFPNSKKKFEKKSKLKVRQLLILFLDNSCYIPRCRCLK